MTRRSRSIETLIIPVGAPRVLLAADLADIYGVETRTLNQAVKRNGDRFPSDFVFQLTREEVNALRSQNVILVDGRARGDAQTPPPTRG